jgi:parallel beta-helix repeat protein
VDNLDLSNTCVGVELLGTEDSIISNNTLSNNRVGICLGYSCNNNNITGNTASNNLIHGIVLENSSNSNNIIGNSANNNYGGGIVLIDSCNNNNITGNTASNNWAGIVLMNSSNNNNIIGNNASYNNCGGIVLGYSCNNNNIIGNNASYNNCNGIEFTDSNNNNITGNNVSNNNYEGISLKSSRNNNITGNNVGYNNYGIYLPSSSNNTITGNTVSYNNYGIYLQSSSNNAITGNNVGYNNYGIYLASSRNNAITGNNVGYNNYGIYLKYSSNNKIYLNNFINNTNNAYSFDLYPVFNLPTNIWNSTEKITSSSSTNIWNSTEQITYTHNGNTYTNYVGNYWSDYKAKYPYAEGIDGCGIWDTPYSIASDNDFYPLMKPCENYLAHAPSVFDTGPGTYPSIRGTHKGTITPNKTIVVHKLYTYPCAGTGGHTESIKLEENGTVIANGTWNGYHEDWHNITLHNITDGTHYVTLLQDHKYNYTIRTGSYPQILHAASKEVTGGTITCTSFVDANGKTYTDGIPAIKFF